MVKICDGILNDTTVQEAHQKFIVAQSLLPLFGKAISKNVSKSKFIEAVTKRAKGLKDLYLGSSIFTAMRNTIDDRHAFNKALTKAGVKLHKNKLFKGKTEVPVDWKDINKALVGSGQGDGRISKLLAEELKEVKKDSQETKGEAAPPTPARNT